MWTRLFPPTIMAKKQDKIQAVTRRAPKQERALHKVGLIFEATMRLLDTVEIASLTTNAIAAKAGISIGTLYQYFKDKDALLDALSTQELHVMGSKVMGAMDQSVPRTMDDRIRLLVGTVFETYGGRQRVHRLLLQHALTQRSGSRLTPLMGLLAEELGREGRAGPRLAPAEAFVLTQAILGVLRAVVATTYPKNKRAELEAALIRLVTRFVQQ